MFELDVNLDGEKTFDSLRELLFQKGCRELAQEPPTSISVKQGSLWGVSPKTAKKTIEFHLSPAGSKTHITVNSSLSEDWKNLTIIGSILSVIMAAFCLWISLDLQGFVTSGLPSLWSWIASSGDLVNVQATLWFAIVTGWLGVFLMAAVLLECIVYAYAKSQIDIFAKETLKTLA